jgi:hypothetical protein
MMKTPSLNGKQKVSILIPAITVIPFSDLKRKNDKELFLIAKEMAEYMDPGKAAGLWAVAKVNFQAIEAILNQRGKSCSKQLSLISEV